MEFSVHIFTLVSQDAREPWDDKVYLNGFLKIQQKYLTLTQKSHDVKRSCTGGSGGGDGGWDRDKSNICNSILFPVFALLEQRYNC